MSENEREVRALEAIIASQLLRERDPMNLDDLPKLTEAQRTVMDAVPANIVEQLWDEVENEPEEECPAEEACTADEEEFVGMNRAEDMGEETRQALDQARKEVMESMKKRKEQDGANS
jgi:hypothetical protein